MNLFFHLLDRSHVAYGLLNSGRLGACIGEGLEVGSMEENRGKWSERLAARMKTIWCFPFNPVCLALLGCCSRDYHGDSPLHLWWKSGTLGGEGGGYTANCSKRSSCENKKIENRTNMKKKIRRLINFQIINPRLASWGCEIWYMCVLWLSAREQLQQ